MKKYFLLLLFLQIFPIARSQKLDLYAGLGFGFITYNFHFKIYEMADDLWVSRKPTNFILFSGARKSRIGFQCCFTTNRVDDYFDIPTYDYSAGSGSSAYYRTYRTGYSFHFVDQIYSLEACASAKLLPKDFPLQARAHVGISNVFLIKSKQYATYYEISTYSHWDGQFNEYSYSSEKTLEKVPFNSIKNYRYAAFSMLFGLELDYLFQNDFNVSIMAVYSHGGQTVMPLIKDMNRYCLRSTVHIPLRFFVGNQKVKKQIHQQL
jgi:hypothetical protein